jgi:hypothetical protein
MKQTIIQHCVSKIEIKRKQSTREKRKINIVIWKGLKKKINGLWTYGYVQKILGIEKFKRGD